MTTLHALRKSRWNCLLPLLDITTIKPIYLQICNLVTMFSFTEIMSKRLLSPSYDGRLKVLSRATKYFCIDKHNQKDSVSIVTGLNPLLSENLTVPNFVNIRQICFLNQILVTMIWTIKQINPAEQYIGRPSLKITFSYGCIQLY